MTSLILLPGLWLSCEVFFQSLGFVLIVVGIRLFFFLKNINFIIQFNYYDHSYSLYVVEEMSLEKNFELGCLL